MPPLSETTYPIPRITSDAFFPNSPVHSTAYQPIYRPFVLPNPYLQGVPATNAINTNNNFVQHSHQVFHQQPTKSCKCQES